MSFTDFGLSWLSEFRRGSEAAFRLVYGRFYQPIHKYVGSRILDEEVARELAQEIFLKVFRFRGEYRIEFAFSTWLWTIARNTVSDYLRAQRGAPRGDVAEADAVVCPGPGAETLLIKKVQRRALFKKIRMLTKTQRRVLWLSVIEQLSYPEIASKLGLTLAAVKNVAYRARLNVGRAHPA